jgi:hypothetical protein
MNTKTIFIKGLVLALFLTVLSCNSGLGPYYMFTKVYPDGSCTREFVRSADSAFVAGDTSKNPFPFKLDSTWKLEFYKRLQNDSSRFSQMNGIEYKTSGDSTTYSWFAIATKKFPTVQSMSAFSLNESSWDSIETRIDFKKKFRWFYTYYKYMEVYPYSNVFKRVPVSDYLTNPEIATLYGESRELYTGKNGLEVKSMLDDLQKKADEWLNRSLYEEIYVLYVKHYNEVKDPPVDVKTFESVKDSIYKQYGKSDSLLKGDFNEILDSYFKTKSFSKSLNDSIEKKLEKEFPDFMKLSEMELDYKLSMPGKIIETNAPFLDNDTLTWKVNSDRFSFNDCVLTAESRKVNYWAFIVTGLLVFSAAASFMVRKN